MRGTTYSGGLEKAGGLENFERAFAATFLCLCQLNRGAEIRFTKTLQFRKHQLEDQPLVGAFETVDYIALRSHFAGSL